MAGCQHYWVQYSEDSKYYYVRCQWCGDTDRRPK
jgi:hypothetical protein